MKSLTRIFIAAAAMILLGTGAAQASSLLRVDGKVFKDGQGRTVILRGVNVAGDSKVPPFRGIDTPAQLDPLKTWGMNVIRLLFNWEAFEPAPGAYDWNYLSHLTNVVDWAWARGIYTIVDFHQDIYSRFTAKGCGEGFPAWALSPDAIPQAPDNGPNCANWAIIGALDEDMHESWRDFYSNREGVRDRYLAVWDILTRNFKAHASVIGYDMLNEPWGYEAEELYPLYEDTARVIRSNDPSAILFVSPAAITSSGFWSWLPKPTYSNYAFAPHFYDATVTMLKVYSGITVPSDLGWNSMAGKASEWGVPLFVGEFGCPGVTFNGLAYMDLQYSKMNYYLAGGAQWVYTPHWTDARKDGWDMEDFSIIDNTGAIRSNNFKPRPFARKISGTATQLTVWDPWLLGDDAIELYWKHNPATGSTELFVPKYTLWGTWPVKIEQDGASCSFDSTQTKVTCGSSSAGSKRVKVRACTMIFGWCL